MPFKFTFHSIIRFIWSYCIVCYVFISFMLQQPTTQSGWFGEKSNWKYSNVPSLNVTSFKKFQCIKHRATLYVALEMNYCNCSHLVKYFRWTFMHNHPANIFICIIMHCFCHSRMNGFLTHVFRVCVCKNNFTQVSKKFMNERRFLSFGLKTCEHFLFACVCILTLLNSQH